MLEVSVDEVRKHLSRLIKKAAKGESFVIVESGRPLVTVSAYAPPSAPSVARIGFLKGMVEVPDDFDTMGRDAIRAMFEGGE